MFKKFLTGTCLLLSQSLLAGEVYTSFPENIDASKKFVFYSHGYIVEGTNPKPINTKNGWGLYDFPAIKNALSDDDYHLIAFHRPKDTEPYKYAYELSKQVRALVAAGVNPQNITIMGFSRGAFITGLTSDKVSDLAVNTIILAGCGRLTWNSTSDIKVYGHVLAINEKTDGSKSCRKLEEKSYGVKSFTEIQINTGLEHGAFYRPIPEWINPVKDWIKSPKPRGKDVKAGYLKQIRI